MTIVISFSLRKEMTGPYICQFQMGAVDLSLVPLPLPLTHTDLLWSRKRGSKEPMNRWARG